MPSSPFVDMLRGCRRKLEELAETDPEEANLLAAAIRRSRNDSFTNLSLDLSPLISVSSAFSQTTLRGKAFRRQHVLANKMTRLTARQLAFCIPPDPIREELGRFCHLMYLGYQSRFLNRHPGEEPEDFLDRPRKRTINITKRLINVKSQLYSDAPVRRLSGDFNDKAKKKLEESWSNPLFNSTMLMVDRLTRLLGTVAVRPFYDDEQPGSIRLWVFPSYKLRVIPDPRKPWKPLAVIERHQPFMPHGRVCVWTNKHLLELERSECELTPHSMGRIPHTFFQDMLSFDSFFVPGEGLDICDANATINDKMSDLNEVIQMQGFSAMEAVNPDDDKPKVGPRRVTVFRPSGSDIPFGINFKNPNAPIAELREDINNDIRNVFQQAGVPEQMSIAGRTRNLSGFAIRLLLRPITEENQMRAGLFLPKELDLADNILRVLNENGEKVDYDKKGVPLQVFYAEPDFPTDTNEQIAKEEHEVALGITTPAELLLKRDPQRFKSIEDATEQWKKNVETNLNSGIPTIQTAIQRSPNVPEDDGQLPEETRGQMSDLLGEFMEEEGVKLG